MQLSITYQSTNFVGYDDSTWTMESDTVCRVFTQHIVKLQNLLLHLL